MLDAGTDAPLTDYLKAKRASIDRVLDRFLPPVDTEPRAVHECMRYSVAGGKRIRPILTMAVADALGCPEDRVLPTGAAIELIHTHSLILDDLPCMDNDDVRRGRPTCHRRFGEAVALLAADAVLNLAIAILGANHRLAGIPAEIALDIIREVGETVGTAGLIGGQAADLDFPIQCRPPDPRLLEGIHLGKTASLFCLSARAGALVAGASPRQLRALSEYALHLGLAFQIIDDVLDHITPTDPVLLTAASSANSSLEPEIRPELLETRRRQGAEPSYAAALGAQAARDTAQRITGRAVEALSGMGDESVLLRRLAGHNLERAA